MAIKKNLSESRRRQLRRQNSRLTEHEQAQNVLKEVKEQAGKVIHIAVTDRTTIEVPADMPKEEIEKRINRYKSTSGVRV